MGIGDLPAGDPPTPQQMGPCLLLLVVLASLLVAAAAARCTAGWRRADRGWSGGGAEVAGDLGARRAVRGGYIRALSVVARGACRPVPGPFCIYYLHLLCLLYGVPIACCVYCAYSVIRCFLYLLHLLRLLYLLYGRTYLACQANQNTGTLRKKCRKYREPA